MKEKSCCIKKMISAIAFCFKMSWNASRYYTIVRMLQQMLGPLLGIALSCLGKYVIDYIAEGNVENVDRIVVAVICISVLNVFLKIQEKVIEYSYSMHNELLQKEAQLSIMNKYLQAEIQAFDDPEFRDCMVILLQDIDSVMNILWNAMKMVSGIIALIISLWITSELGMIYIVLLLVMCLPSVLFNKLNVKELYEVINLTAKDERLCSYFYNVACDKQYALQTRMYNIEKLIQNKFFFHWKKKFSLKKNKMKEITILSSVFEIVPYICIGFIMIIVVKSILEGKRSIGDYTLYSTLLIQLLSDANLAFESILQIYNDYLHIYNVRRIQTVEKRNIVDGTVEIDDITSIAFKNVTFSYPGVKKEALKNVSFTIENRDKVALIGTNGSGKSTIIKLLLRFYDVDDGAILINNIPIEKISIKSLRKNISVYFQNEPNFVMSLKENIMLSNNGITNLGDEDIIQLLKDCGGSDIIERTDGDLSMPYSKEYYDFGVEFSEGQKQKISVARTLFKKASAYVLDEPSAALDPEAEYKLLCAMKKYSKTGITIFVSHRMSNMRLANKILLMEEGKKIAFGSHEELMECCERYKELYSFQTKKI